MNRKRGTLFGALYTGVACAIIMALLQPFGVDRVEHYKYPIIIGYAVLAAIAYLLADLLTTYLLRIPMREEWNFKRNITIGLLICPIMGAIICCYAALVSSGDIRHGWFYPDGSFTLRAFWINCGYMLIISFFLTLFGYYMERSRQLASRLQEVIELNEVLAQRLTSEKKVLIAKEQRQGKGSADTAEASGTSDISASPDSSSASFDNTGVSAHPLRLEGSSRETVELHSSTELLFVESDGNYALVHYLCEGRAVHKALRCTLKQAEEQLSEEPYIMRCHRAYIVNIARVEHVSGNGQGYRLTLEGTKEQVPVSRQYAADIYRSIKI